MSPAILLALLLQTGDLVPVPPEPPPCRKPALSDRVGLSQDDLNGAGEAAQAYVSCMRSFIDTQTQLANSLMAKARSHAEANNKAAAEVNDFITTYRGWVNERRLAQ